MRHAVAALVIARTVPSRQEEATQTSALADDSPGVAAVRRRRRWWSVAPLSVWKATHPGG